MTKPYLKVTHLKGALTLQDLGRASAQHLGFSASGAADEHAFLYANQLLSLDSAGTKQNSISNDDNIAQNSHGHPVSEQLNQAALEITFGQASFTTSIDCTIAITGADCQASINDQPIKNWQTHTLLMGDILRLHRPLTGMYSYLAVQGGLSHSPAAPLWLGSQAQTQNEMALAFVGQKIDVGSQLYFPPEQLINLVEIRNSNSTVPKNFYAQKQLTLRFIPSTLFQQLSKKQQAQFSANHYTISSQSNRMGYRLIPQDEDGKIQAKATLITAALRQKTLLSVPVAFGTIQLPANEHPIVLMKERQTMGGYPTLGCVMKTDLFRLSQMRPGDTIIFIATTLEKSQQQLIQFYKKFRDL
jgi:biotin-dependent carboxylase-like uncharacterized protein